MEITRDIEKLIESDYDQIENFEVTYKNGGKVCGIAKSITFNPLNLTIKKNKTKRFEKSTHQVVFDHVTKITLFYLDKSQRSLS